MYSFRQAKASENLYDFWQQEMELRIQLREQNNLDITVAQDSDELDFLLRALYFGGRQEEFFLQLKTALNTAPALQWWKSRPEWLKKEFFAFLIDNPAYDSDSRQLQFLIHLWEPELSDIYIQVLSQLTLSQCRYLLSKTANGTLRSLLKSRENHLIAEQKNRHYGMLKHQDLQNINLPSTPEKKELIKTALLQLEKTSPRHNASAYDTQRYRALLDTVERVYQCGLIQDALGLLIQLYQAYQNQPDEQIMQDQRLIEKLSRLAAKTIGTLVLAKGDLRLTDQASQLWCRYFPDLIVDRRLVLMLSLYEAILSSVQQAAASLPWEVLSCYESVQQLFPEDSLAELRMLDSLPGTGKKLLELSHSLITSSPWESFIIMELIRLLLEHSLIHLEKDDGAQLLMDYIDLWKWLPSRRFINEKVINQLAYGAPPSLRQEAERIIYWSKPGMPERLLADWQKRPDLYRDGTEPIRTLALFGYLLGVLE